MLNISIFVTETKALCAMMVRMNRILSIPFLQADSLGHKNNLEIHLPEKASFTSQKVKFSFKDFSSKCDQICSFLRFGHIY